MGAEARHEAVPRPIVSHRAEAEAGVALADARRVIASSWATEARPEQAAFRAWTERYFAVPPGAARELLLPEGNRLAAERSAALAGLIVRDPEAALAAAVPAVIRAALPASITSLLERRISGRGELALNAVTPAPGAPLPAESTYRSALLGGEEFRAYVYGKRALQATVADAAIVGIAMDGLLAVADSPLRLLEPGEITPPASPRVTTCEACASAAGAPTSASVFYEYAGRIGAAPSYAHFLSDASALEAAERDLTEADNRPGTSAVVGRPTKAWTHGVKKLLIIRVDFPDKPGVPLSGSEPITEARAVEMFTGEGGVGDFYLASSFGLTTTTIRPAVGDDSPDVTPVLRLSRNAVDYAVTGESTKLHDDARGAAENAGYDVSAYDRVGVVFSSLSGLVDSASGAKSKITYGGLATVLGPNFWVNGAYSFRVVAHELGHTYGLRHANLWKVSDGDPVSEAGRSLEYGDPFDLMGGGEDFSATEDFGPWNKSLLQWIPDSAVTVAGGDGVYRVHRIDAAGADLGLPRALKIVRDPTRDYWIGYRRATDNATLNSGAYVIWGYNTNRPGDLLDLSGPGSDPTDSALALGEAFADNAAAITLKPIAQGGSGADEWIDVEVIIGRRIQWLSAAVLAPEQSGAVSLTLRRSGSPVGTISVGYATEDVTAMAGSDYTAAAGVVTWADGDMADKTVAIPLSPDGEAERPESFRVRLEAVEGGARVGPAVAVVTIAEAGATDDTFLSDSIGSTVNRLLPLPDGSVLAGGGFTWIQDSAGSLLGGVGRLARFTASGAVDVEFSAGAGANDQVRGFALQQNGRVLVVGDFTTFAGVSAGRIVRLFPDGSLDRSFKPGAGANEDIHDVVIQPDGRILLVGAFTKFGTVARNRIVRLMPDGAVDTSFADPAFSATILRSLALQPDGKVLVGGGLSYSGLSGVGFKSGVARLNANGSRDASFDVGHGAHTAGATNTLTSVFRLALQPDGRVLVAGSFTGFGGLGGKPRQFLARLAANGAVDGTFAPSFSFPSTMPAEQRIATALRALPGDRVLVGGNFTGVDSLACSRYALLGPDGRPDASFAEAGGHAGRVMDIALLPDGKAMLAGDPAAFQGSSRPRPLWRFVPGLSGAPGSVEFSAGAYVGREGGSVTLTVTRVGGSLGAATVAYAAARAHPADSATRDLDYGLADGVLTWADGDASERTITIPLHRDSISDDGETFTVRLGEPVLGGVALGETREATVTIDLKAPLTIAPNNQRRLVGLNNDAISLHYTGLRGADIASDLDRLPTAKTTAKKTSKPGTYPITLSGGSDNNYAFQLLSGTIEVVGFGGTYEALLLSDADGRPAGKVDVVVSATGPGFTVGLNWEGEGSPLSLRGTLDLRAEAKSDPSKPAVAEGKTLAAAHGYGVTITALDVAGVHVELSKNGTPIARGSGSRIFVPAAKTAVAWAGPRGAWLGNLEPLSVNDTRPVPAGAGHAVFAVPAGGAITVTFHLPDGVRMKVPMRPDSTGIYRIFGRPYGARAGSYLAGEWDLKTFAARSFIWRKTAATGAKIDASFRPGFGVQGTSELFPWTAPRVATASVPAITWADILRLDIATGLFGLETSGVELSGLDTELPSELVLTPAGKVVLPAGVTANPRKLALTLTSKTGAFSGSFTLVDGRKVLFGGALRPAQSDLAEEGVIGNGFFVVPPSVKGAESTLGAVRLLSPSLP